MCLAEYAGAGRIAIEYRQPFRTQCLCRLPILLDDDVGHGHAGQRLSDRASHATVTHDDGVPPKRGLIDGGWQFRDRAGGTLEHREKSRTSAKPSRYAVRA